MLSRHHLRLYRSLVLPTMDYGVSALLLRTKLVEKFGQIQTAALLKASRCLCNSSSEAVDVLSNYTPIHLHINLTQAGELQGIYSKQDIPTLKGKKTIYNIYFIQLLVK